MEPTTTMGTAFAAAGYESPYDKLRRLMAAAGDAGGWQGDPTIDGFIRLLLAENDAVLVWELCAEVRMSAMRRLFGIALHEAKLAKQDVGQAAAETQAIHAGVPRFGGHVHRGTQKGVASDSPPGGGQSRSETQTRSASGPAGVAAAGQPASGVVTPSPHLPAVLPPRHTAVRADAILGVAKKSALDRVDCNGRPIGDVSYKEAFGSANQRGRYARFIKLLLSRLPENAKRIRDHISPEEAEQCMSLAEMDEAA
jgi:hypothetical protein